MTTAMFRMRPRSTACRFIGPRYLIYAAALEMHPLDTDDRLRDLEEERVVDRSYDPVTRPFRVFMNRGG